MKYFLLFWDHENTELTEHDTVDSVNQEIQEKIAKYSWVDISNFEILKGKRCEFKPVEVVKQWDIE